MANNTQTLKPFRSYDEHDVVNLFALDFNTVDLNADPSVKIQKGVLVTVQDNGWRNTDEALDSHGLGGATSTSAPGKSFANTVSLRYGTTARVAPTKTTEVPLGITLWDMAERDENGEKLLYHPRKAAEMQAIISGQSVPIATRGVFLYSGATLNATHATQGPVAGEYLYAAAAGQMMVASSVGWNSTVAKVGQVLGGKDSNNHVLIRLDV